MDIENMHPFCLPFGFCHDATSSSIAADFSNSTNNNNNNESSNSTSIENNSKDKVRSKTTSPTDELFRHLNNASSSASFLHEDLIIGSSTSLDLDGDGIYSLELGIDIDQHDDNNENNNNNSTFITNDDDDLSDLKEFNHDDDWFCNQYSLFSPDALDATASGHPGRRKSLLRTLFSHGPNSQVFQHVVDPIDIKSSPTLAQLNLNSNDDPTDGLWDTGAGTNHQNQASSTNIDLLSNCTSINRNSRVASSVASAAVVGGIHDADSNDDNCISNQHSTSCHLHHNHPHHHHHHLHAHHTHHRHSSGPQFVHLVSHRSTNTTCNHLHNHNHGLNQHHHHHQHQQQMSANGCCSEHSCGDTASAQHQCLAVPPFRKAGLPNQCPSACCHNNSLVATATQMAHANSNNGSNLKPSATLNQLNQQMSHNNLSNLHQLSSSSTTTNQQQHHHHHEKHTSNCSQKVCANHQQRSASPALVTSSSSPGNLSAENRLIDNKLKENIEYLTALLCNGNKMEASAACTNQQSSISSTMVRSYATLAHSLSTGPKLLERHLHTHGPQMSAASNVAPISAQLASATGPQVKNAPTNEASPCASAPGCNNNDQSLSQLTTASNTTAAAGTANPLKRQHGSDGQWFKYAVESSVSAADSTESQVTSLSNSKDSMTLHHQLPLQQLLPHPHLAHLPSVHQQPLVPLSNQHLCTHQASQLGIIPPGHHQMPHPDDHRRQRTPELKVLSSLLNSNKCASQPAQTNLMQHVIQPAVPVSGAWPNTRLITTTAPHQQLPVPPGSALGDQPNHVPVKTSTTSLTPQQSTDPSKQHVAQSHQVSNIPLNGKPITLTPIATSNGILAQQLKSQRAPHFAQPASPSASSTDSSGCGNTLTTNSSDTSSVTSISTNNNKRQRAGNDVTAASGQKGRVGRPNSLSTDCSMSSHDEGFASQIDNDDGVSMRDSDDDEDDIDSDDESFYGDYTNSDLIGASISDNAENKWTLNMGRTRRNGQKRYFWQYNVQSKGPKGTRICSTDDSEDPFVLPEASDPVFSNDCQIEGVKHSGKARRGDGNDLTPNPRKLLMIGLELKKLGKIINDLAPVTDLPLNARNKTRKEKNKLASRACRLKKKAQHEANKIKLYGLQREHQQVVMAIYDVRKLLNENLLKQNDKKKTKEQTQATSGTCQMMDVTEGSTIDNNNCDPAARQIAEQCSMRVAGQTSDYVNSVLEKVVSGCIDGGLQT